MKAAMQEPLFVEFADQCLKVVEGEGNALFSNDWFIKLHVQLVFDISSYNSKHTV